VTKYLLTIMFLGLASCSYLAKAPETMSKLEIHQLSAALEVSIKSAIFNISDLREFSGILEGSVGEYYDRSLEGRPEPPVRTLN